jgi:2-dehydropantoate 2-reductase
MKDAVQSPSPKIVVAGAGSIGCFVGGALAAAGRDVRFLARPRCADELAAHGLTLSDRDGRTLHLAATSLVIGVDPALLGSADIVLVTVKSGATREIAASIRQSRRRRRSSSRCRTESTTRRSSKRCCPAGRW